MTATSAMTSNDPRDLDGKRLQLAMQTLGRDPVLRARMIAGLRYPAMDLCPALVVRPARRSMPRMPPLWRTEEPTKVIPVRGRFMAPNFTAVMSAIPMATR